MFIAIGIFFVFLLLGMPVAFSIGLSGFSFFMIRDLPMTVLVQKSISTSQALPCWPSLCSFWPAT